MRLVYEKDSADRVWAVRIHFGSGETYEILTGENEAQRVFTEWTELVSGGYENPTALVQLSGFTNSADSAACLVAFLAKTIKGIDIWFMH